MSRVVVVDFTPATWARAFSTRPELAPYVARLEGLADAPDWPAVEHYRALLSTRVDFVPPATRLPAGLDASDVDDSYIGRCVRGEVPTRPRNLHDFMNALTWAAFPTAKDTLCRRQVEVARARGLHTNRLRTKAQDLLAMLDEGGVVDVDGGGRLAFGHGLLEDLVLGRTSRGRPLPVARGDDAGIAAALAALELPFSPAAR